MITLISELEVVDDSNSLRWKIKMVLLTEMLWYNYKQNS